MTETRTISQAAVARANIISRICAVGLSFVLAIVMVFGMYGAVATRGEAERAKLIVEMSNRFERARSAVAEEEASRNAFALRPGPRTRRRHEAAARATTVALREILRNADAQTRPGIVELLAEQGRYAAATRAGFDALERGDHGGFDRIDRARIAPLFARMALKIDNASVSAQSYALHNLDALAKMQEAITETTRIVAVIGIALLGIFLVIFRTYKRRIDEAMRAEIERLEQAGFKDNLTGLGNHRAYQEAIAREIARAERGGESFSLALIDVDEFKYVNDRSGHAHGDVILTMLAHLLGEFRAGDVAFRLGGDEFALLLANTTLRDAATAMERLRASAQRRLLGSTISVGIADLSCDRDDSASLKEQADAALYEAKRRGRNLVVSVDELEDFDAILSSAKMQALRALLKVGAIEIAFQPIWDIKTGSVLGLEALARLPLHCGLEGAQEAFDIAEKIGRAHDLDALCREAVLARAGDLPPGPLLFLNVSPQSLDHDNLAGNALVDAVRAVGLEPGRVVLELTERSFARPHVVIREARRLQRLGFRLALDDTGAGNSGLEVLSQLNVDFVKIDRNVIVNAMTDRSARGVLAGIIAIAQQTEAYVIAEGLEDEAMFSLVTSIGTAPAPAFSVQGAQGYLFGRPTGDVHAAMRMPAAAPPLQGETSTATDPLSLIA